MNIVRLKQIIKKVPFVQHVRRKLYERRFRTAEHTNLFYGVYPTYKDAQKACPDTKPLGYDHEAPANMYTDRMRRIYETDYPVLYWLAPLIKPNASLLEVGGHIGVSYYAYRKYIKYPEGFRWSIYDVAAVVAKGREIAELNQVTNLQFKDSLNEVDQSNIFLSMGSLQYIEESLPEMLINLTFLPETVILNLTPVSGHADYFTVQNIGTAFCPYKITNEKKMIEGMQALGYKLRDMWRNENKGCWIPFSDVSYTLDHYKGFCFSLGNR